MATQEITISELELADEILGDMNIPVDTATETRAVTLKQLRAWLGSSLPTGFIIPAVGKISDERFTLLDGKTLSRAGTYEAFCNKVVSEVQAGNWFACSEDEYNSDISNYGQCGKFVVSNDYVRIPTITRFIGATITLSEIGKTYKESLPKPFANIGDGLASYVGSGGTNAFVAGPYVQAQNYTSDTYQDGAKVQPDHTKYLYYMVISTEGQTANVEIDINQVYEDLNLKANSDLSNVASVSQTFKDLSVGWGMPDYTAGIQVKNSNTAQGTYTTEFDCLFLVRFLSAGYCHWQLSDGGADMLCGNNGSNYTQIPVYVRKGVTLTGIGAGGTWNVYVFPLRGAN